MPSEVTVELPAEWWTYHSRDCGIKYRGCAPHCPKHVYEQYNASVVEQEDLEPEEEYPLTYDQIMSAFDKDLELLRKNHTGRDSLYKKSIRSLYKAKSPHRANFAQDTNRAAARIEVVLQAMTRARENDDF